VSSPVVSPWFIQSETGIVVALGPEVAPTSSRLLPGTMSYILAGLQTCLSPKSNLAGPQGPRVLSA
jgi:hypothetical protein